MGKQYKQLIKAVTATQYHKNRFYYIGIYGRFFQ